MAPFIDSVSGLVAAQWVGLTFAFASAGKFLDRTAAVTAVERFQLPPTSVARIVGTLLPWIELLLALSLIVGVAARAGAGVAIALLLLFSIAQATVLVQGRRVECGCFGSLSSEPVPPTAVRISWALMAAIAIPTMRCGAPPAAGLSSTAAQLS